MRYYTDRFALKSAATLIRAHLNIGHAKQNTYSFDWVGAHRKRETKLQQLSLGGAQPQEKRLKEKPRLTVSPSA